MALLLNGAAQAQDFTYNTNNGTITITAYIGPGGSVTIPGTINGLPVTSIASYAFSGRASMINVAIPDSVTNIGDFSFFYCTGLSSATMGSGLSRIGVAAFAGCASLTNVTIPGNVTTIADGAATKGGLIGAFSSCTSLTNLTIGNGVTSIGDSAFSGCSNLASVTLPASVVRIGADAFRSCASLTRVTIPKSVTTIDNTSYAPGWVNGPFFDCTSLSAITVDPGNPVYSSLDGVLFNKTQTTLIAYPGGRPGNYTIPATVTYIDYRAFGGCTNLTGLTLGDSVNSIGLAAFSSCTGLTNLTLGNTVTNIGGSGFENCSSLRGITIPNNVVTIGDSAFAGCHALIDITLGNGVTSIGASAFSSCISLSSLIIGNSVTSIGDAAFSYCTALASITIGSGVTNLGPAFFRCPGLTTIMVDPLNAFYSSLDGVLFDKSQTTLLQYPSHKSQSYTIPAMVTAIGASAFNGCTNLVSVIVGNGVTTVGDNAFAACTNLTNVTLGNSVTRIDNWAFSYCSKLSGISFPGKLASIRDYAFAGCTSMTSITIPNSVTNLGYVPFWLCTGLTNITLGNGITTIGQQFQDCSSLTSITIPASVTSIGDGAFAGCSSLRGIYFEGNAPGFAFCGCFQAFGTVYFLPGTTGWGPTFAGRPTALWNPQAQIGDASFGLRQNRFGFNISGTADIPLLIEGSANLAAQSWVPLQSCTLTNGLIYFSDAQWTNYPARIYRIRSP